MRPVEDDPEVPGLSNRKGTVSLALPQDGDGSIGRSTQLVFQLSDNGGDGGGVAGVPLGEVVSGIEVLESMVEQHPTAAMSGDNLKNLYEQGDRFLSRYDSDLPFIHSARYNNKRKQHMAAAASGVGRDNDRSKQDL